MFVEILAFLVFAIYFIFRECVRPKNFPAGPPFLPIIGSWYDIPAIGVFTKIPQWRKKYGNIIGHKMGHRYMVFIAGTEEIIAGLKNSNFQSRLPLTAFGDRSFKKLYLGLFFGNGEHWSKARRFTQRYLGQIMNTKLEIVVREELFDLFSRILPGRVTVINHKFMNFSIKTMVGVLIDRKNKEKYSEEIETIRDLTKRAFQNGRSVGIELVYPWMKIFFNFNAFFKAIKYIQNFCKERIKEHRDTFDSNNIRDYFDAFLLEKKKENECSTIEYYSDEQLITCFLDIVQASSESIGNTAAFLLMYVSLNPSIQDKIHEELDRVVGRNKYPSLEDKERLPYCEATLYETMRINTIAPISVPHVVSQETSFRGYTFSKNTILIFAFQELCNDPNVYSEPELFKPERFLSKDMKMKLINFGLGKRSCIGDIFSKNVLFLFVTFFFQRYTISFPSDYENPSTVADPGFTTSPKPFKLIIKERL